MSTLQLIILVLILNGSNYGLWFMFIKAYLISIGLWVHANGDLLAPFLAADRTPHPNFAKWTRTD